MKFGLIPLHQAEGKILAHKILLGDGKKSLRKGRVLSAADIKQLKTLDISSVMAAEIEADDLDENQAAQEIAEAVAGQGVSVKSPGVGRAHLLADTAGVLRINVPLLNQINAINEGIALSTLYEHSVIDAKQLLALVKIIPFGIPAVHVKRVEDLTKEFGPMLSVQPLKPHSVGLIISGPESAKSWMLTDYTEPVRSRIENWGSTLDAVIYTAHKPDAIGAAIREQIEAGRELLLLVGISAIMDRADVIPSAVEQSGGMITQFGIPIDPGNLLMLGYRDHIPIIGAPGCIRSPKTNALDRILPRLLTGERLVRSDLVVMGHGGLLDDIHQRPMPRSSA